MDLDQQSTVVGLIVMRMLLHLPVLPAVVGVELYVLVVEVLVLLVVRLVEVLDRPAVVH